MKRTIVTAITTAIVTAAIAIACFAGCAKKSVKQTATAYLDQEGNTVTATVDLSDGYSCEFARGAIYLYDRENKDGVEAVVIAMTLDEEVFNGDLAAAESAADRKDVNGGVMYSADGEMIWLCKVGDSAYFKICAENATATQMEKYIARFSVVPEI